MRIMVRMERGVWGDVGCVGRVESRWGQVCVWGRESTHVPVESSESCIRLSKSVINQFDSSLVMNHLSQHESVAPK